MRHYRKRPLTKRILSCIKRSSYIEYRGEPSHLFGESNTIYWWIGCTPKQLAKAIYSLRKQGKLAAWDGNRDGFYELPLTLGEWGIRQAWVTGVRQELDDHKAVLEVDSLLRTKQRVENDR